MVLRDVTNDFLEWLFPPLNLLTAQRPANPKLDANAIVQRTGVIIGSQGSGKTTLMERISEHAIAFYPDHLVAAKKSKAHIAWSFKYAFIENVPIHIFYCDDITYRKPEEEDIAFFFNVRHQMRQETGLNWGLMVFVVGSHRFHGIPLPFRTTTDFQIWKDIPTNPWDLFLTRKFIGEEGVNFLLSAKDKWIESPEAKSKSIVKFGRKMGILSAGLPIKNWMRDAD